MKKLILIIAVVTISLSCKAQDSKTNTLKIDSLEQVIKEQSLDISRLTTLSIQMSKDIAEYRKKAIEEQAELLQIIQLILKR
jgi:hypothetical protein